MKIVYISDLHLRNLTTKSKNSSRKDYLPSRILENLDYIVEYCINDPNIKYVIFGGDIGDSVLWDSTLLIAASNILSKLKVSKIEAFSCVGNHDCIGKNWETYSACGLGVLERLNLVYIPKSKLQLPYYTSNTELDPSRVVEVTFYHADSIEEKSLHGKEIELYLEKETNDVEVVCSIGVAHSSIGPYRTEYLKGIEDLKELPYDYFLLADIHKRIEHKQNSGCIVLNPGPVERFSLTEIDEIPSFLVLDIQNNDYEFVTIPHEPSEEVFIIKSKVKASSSVNTTHFLDSIESLINREKLGPKELIYYVSKEQSFSDEERDLLCNFL